LKRQVAILIEGGNWSCINEDIGTVYIRKNYVILFNYQKAFMVELLHGQ